MSREVMRPNIPDVPDNIDKALRDFLLPVKQILELFTGRSRAGSLERVVTERGLQNMGLPPSLLLPNTKTMDLGGYFTSDKVPKPPTTLVVQSQVFANVLAWTNPADMEEISHVEIWAGNVQNRSAAILVGIETAPGNRWTHNAINVKLNYYYWIRTVTFGGKYSAWEPIDAQGGYLVPSGLKGTINEMMNALTQNDTYQIEYKIIADAFKVIKPSSVIDEWDSGTDYGFGEFVWYGNPVAYYKSTQTPNQGNQPDSSPTYWVDVTDAIDSAQTVFIIGDIDGAAAVGINGGLIVDGTIIGRHLDADIITGVHISAQAQIALADGGSLTIGSSGTLSIGANGLLTMANGGMMVVGNDQVIIDSNANSIIVAPDGGPVGNDYAELKGDSLKLYYWDAAGHNIYKSLTRVESGTASNGDIVILPGIWKEQPKIIVSPRNVQICDKTVATTQDQFIEVIDNAPYEDPAGSRIWKFVPEIRLVKGQGLIVGDVPEASVSVFNGSSCSNGSSYTTPANTIKVKVTGTCNIEFSHVNSGVSTAQLYVYINGVPYLVVDKTEVLPNNMVPVNYSIGFSKTIDIVAGSYSVYLRACGSGTTYTGANVSSSGTIAECTISGSSEVADGTVNWMASGN